MEVGPGRERRCSGRSGPFAMPHKANVGRRHPYPSTEAARDQLGCRRGSLTVWFTNVAIAS